MPVHKWEDSQFNDTSSQQPYQLNTILIKIPIKLMEIKLKGVWLHGPLGLDTIEKKIQGSQGPPI